MYGDKCKVCGDILTPKVGCNSDNVCKNCLRVSAILDYVLHGKSEKLRQLKAVDQIL